MSAAPKSANELRALIQHYIDEVRTGRRVVGKFERRAVERHLRDLERVEAGETPNLRFDADDALHVLRFAERYVRHTKGEWAGRRFSFDPRSAWIAFILWSVFGWKRHHADNDRWYRRFRIAYVSVARKNGKTMLAAIIALYMLAFDGEAGAEVYFAATKRDQAKIGWRQAAQIVQRSRSSELRSLVQVQKSTSTLFVETEDSYCVPLGRDADSHDGLNPHAAIVDELHAHPHRDQWDVLRSGMGARREPLMFGITTAGARRDGLCWDLDHLSQQILAGVIEDESVFAYVARLDEGDDAYDETNWPKANPNLGVSVSIEDMRDEARGALHTPAARTEFLRKRANVWTSTAKAWLALEQWDACYSDTVSLDALRGEYCYVGVDLSKSDDFTAAVAVFGREDGTYEVFPWFWIPEASIEQRVRRDRVPVDEWVRAGLVTATPGEIIDHDYTKEWIVELGRRYSVQEIVFDPAMALQLMSGLQGEGWPIVAFSQAWTTMHAAFVATEELIQAKRLRHAGHPVLRWMFHNVCVRANATGLRRPDKANSGDRIDGIVAMVMGVGRAVVQRGVGQPQIWSVGE